MSVLYNYIGVGDITYASTESVLDLIELYRNLEDLEASGGGDTPEYSLDAMLKALKFSVYDDSGTLLVKVMNEGSQMILITDATSKHQILEPNVIEMANELGVCIHVFVTESGDPGGLYQRITVGTSGTLVTPFSNWDIATFASSYKNSPCSFELGRKKRAAIGSTSRCHSFQISELSILFRFSGNTDSSVILTRPSGTTIEVLGGTEKVAVHSERHPEPGEWLACLSSGDLVYSVDQDYSLDATLGYLKKTDTGTIVASISPPTEYK